MAFSFGFNSNKQKQTQTTSIAPEDYNRQVANYNGAQGLAQTYSPVSASQIQNYMNPYTNDVINASLGDLNQGRLMALNTNKENAIGQGAFSSYDGRAVADSLTNNDFARQAGLLSANLRNQGYGQALQTAQDENRYGYAYPVARQGLLNQTLAGITPTTTTTGTGKSSGWNFGFTGGGGGGGGGGDSSTNDMIMQLLQGGGGASPAATAGG